ncbi:hypothetical protein STRAU_1709 [Streptomyces aurantiacus JA 4570]|uniref:Uncharacterized protein n=1 Tax=Streptomyces aurantiacus JA 4570 TaxID=1286094 RepID=S3ZPV6_9ACTN|nr:hypothetical protein STRAU_1709 [Streptomyces aurantiacus JA 4570]
MCDEAGNAPPIGHMLDLQPHIVRSDPADEFSAARVRNGVRVDAWATPGIQVPPRHAVTLKEFVEGMHGCLCTAVSAGEAIAGGVEGGRTPRSVLEVIEFDTAARNENRCSAQHALGLDPVERHAAGEEAARVLRQPLKEVGRAQVRRGNVGVHWFGACRFGMPELDGLHHARHSGRGFGDSLPLCDGQALAERPDHHEDGEADAIEPRDVRHPGDAVARESRGDKIPGFVGGTHTMCAFPEDLPHASTSVSDSASDEDDPIT